MIPNNMSLIEFTNLAIGVPFLDRGRDFNGWDCWGLVHQGYHKCYGIDLPGYEHISAMKLEEAGEIIDKQKELWTEVTNKELPGDVIVLRFGSWPCQVGLVVKPGLMLHVESGIETCTERYTSAVWNKRVIGHYRHADRTN
jgi:cell wall-associated NlpC family hydrolase